MGGETVVICIFSYFLAILSNVFTMDVDYLFNFFLGVSLNEKRVPSRHSHDQSIKFHVS